MINKAIRLSCSLARKAKSFFDCIKSSMRYKGSLEHKFVYLRFLLLARKKGVIPFRWTRIADMYTEDFFNYQEASKAEKKWAYAHGFSSYKLADWYGVTKENHPNYMSDFVFYQPRNYIQTREIESLYEHKCCTFFSLQPFKDSMPRHYFFLRKGRVVPLDVDEKRDYSITSIVSLIKEKPIAAKACVGGHGLGFFKLVYDSNEGLFIVNNIQSKNEEELLSLLSQLDNYIITDFEIPKKDYVDLCGPNAFAVIRVITVFDPKDGPQLTAALIRLGCKESGVTTDYRGTIYCGITLDDGVTFKPLIRITDDLCAPCPEHPDTHKQLSGLSIPDWESLKKLVLDVSGYLAITPYLVIDIVPTDRGFAILEINSHGQVRNMEPFYPFFENKYNRKVFKR